jgi:hypothetical protein
LRGAAKKWWCSENKNSRCGAAKNKIHDVVHAPLHHTHFRIFNKIHNY